MLLIKHIDSRHPLEEANQKFPKENITVIEIDPLSNLQDVHVNPNLDEENGFTFRQATTVAKLPMGEYFIV